MNPGQEIALEIDGPVSLSFLDGLVRTFTKLDVLPGVTFVTVDQNKLTKLQRLASTLPATAVLYAALRLGGDRVRVSPAEDDWGLAT